jgi:hypothetical protein
MAAGKVFTVTVAVIWQPVDNVYVTTQVPADTPVTTPDAGSIVSIEAQALLQPPPAGVLLNVVVSPTHTPNEPEMADGSGFTVMPAVMIQPVGSVYVIVAVPPLTPLATPLVEPMVATDVLLLLQVPPAVPLINVVVVPWQKV